jgi:2-keto-3-deoxy-L-rhamnonate aldolase RhmA
MRTNTAKAKLKAGETVVGTYVRYGDPTIAEVLCYLGYDFLMFDGEHAPIGERECENLARVCESTGVTSIARVPSNLAWTIGRTLDTGIQGVQIPMVNTGAEAAAAVRAAKYAPMGTRGLAGARAAQYGQVLPFAYPDYIARANAETMVIVQVETPEAIENLAEIVAVPEIDVIFIGPNDLSLSSDGSGGVRSDCGRCGRFGQGGGRSGHHGGGVGGVEGSRGAVYSGAGGGDSGSGGAGVFAGGSGAVTLDSILSGGSGLELEVQ